MTALYLLFADQEEMEWMGDVWDLDINYADALETLKKFDFNILDQSVEIDNASIPAEYILEKKVRIKHNGAIWIIHKNDLDPFPSSPHAHNLDLNQKLDLSNGNCYDKKRLIFKISKKEFLAIRKKAEEVFPGDLPTLAI